MALAPPAAVPVSAIHHPTSRRSTRPSRMARRSTFAWRFARRDVRHSILAVSVAATVGGRMGDAMTAPERLALEAYETLATPSTPAAVPPPRLLRHHPVGSRYPGSEKHRGKCEATAIRPALDLMSL
jgi:hypothetical protein